MFRIQEEAALTFHTSEVTPVCVQVLMSDTRCHSCPYSGAIFPGGEKAPSSEYRKAMWASGSTGGTYPSLALFWRLILL